MDLIRVGAFELYPGERRLEAAGKPVEIGARAFDLLLVLAESPGRLVNKATLIERVWPRLVVDENNLPAQIASLRRILGAGAIRTVPRFGYRLDLPVSRPGAAGAPVDDSASVPRAWRSFEPPGTVPRHGELVGRSEDLEAIRRTLERERVVTLVGTAGVGKSRLAREALALEQERGDAVTAFVPLEAIDSIDHVPSAIALALGISMPEKGDRFQALRLAIDQLRPLIVLDGAEHLDGALAAPVETLVASTPGLRILVTSQAPLGRAGEALYRLGPLPTMEAARLFAQRAAQADQRFELGPGNRALVEDICRQLDGNPLAIELAAARAPAFGVVALLAHLGDRFRLLRLSGQPAGHRHGVLQAAYDWSYGLMTAPEQRVFDRLGAFAGGFALDVAAHAVADAEVDVPGAVDLIGRLVDRSLVTMLPCEPARYALLESARCYARARLDATATRQEADRRMAEAMLELLNRAYRDYWSMDEALWLHLYVPELDNVRAALDWARRNDPGLAVALYGGAWPLFVETDLQEEARAAHDEAVGLLSDATPPERIARFWEAVATYDSERQADRARCAAEIAAGAHARTGDRRSECYSLLQYALNARDDLEAASRAVAAARRLEQPAWPSRLLAHCAIVEGSLLASAGRYAEARAACRRALDHALVASERQSLATTVQIVELDVASGALAGALQLARPLAISLRHSGRQETRLELLSLLFGALVLEGELEEAREIGIELHALARRLDFARLYPVLDAMALLAAREGRVALAARIFASAEAAHASHGQLRPRPASECIRREVESALDASPGAGWRDLASGRCALLQEEDACLRALGLRADA